MSDANKESERLAALYRYNILDTPAEEAFDRITNIARVALNVSFSFITLIDRHRQWFKSHQGTQIRETSRDVSFCSHTIQGNDIMEVPNLRKDKRFAKNPYVVGLPYLRYYCGVPLCTKEGFNIGSLCVMGYRPRKLTKDEKTLLSDLARLTIDEIELRSIADVDYLTGLAARPMLFRQGEREIEQLKGSGLMSSIIVFEINHFKSINQKYGHRAGDSVLQSVADLCRPMIKKDDMLARAGGEQFAVLMRGMSSLEANKLADKIIAVVEGTEIPYNDTRIKTSCSVGIITFRASEQFKTIYSRAEIALHKSRTKTGGQEPRFVPAGEVHADYSYETVPLN